MIEPALYNDLRHDFFRVCVFIAANSLLANFIPPHERFEHHPKFHAAYRLFIDCIAAFALNVRVQLPSLDAEWFGLKREIRHTYRNWRQDRIDRLQRRMR